MNWSSNSHVNSAKAKGTPSKPVKSIYSVPIDGRTWYGGTFPVYSINRRAVHHTWSLFERSQDRYPENVYGDNFTYNEIFAQPNLHRAVLYILKFSVFVIGLILLPVRSPCFSVLARVLTPLETCWIIKRLMPRPGGGPAPLAFPCSPQ